MPDFNQSVDPKSIIRNHLLHQSLRIEYNIDGNPIYVGSADPGASTADPAWRICHLIYSGTNPTIVEWADGNNHYDNIWDNHASLTYS